MSRVKHWLTKGGLLGRILLVVLCLISTHRVGANPEELDLVIRRGADGRCIVYHFVLLAFSVENQRNLPQNPV